MPGKNKHPMLGWHTPAERAEKVRAEAERRGVTVTVVLDEMLDDWLAKLEGTKS